MYISEKVNGLPPYLFQEFNKKKRELEMKGFDVIDLGIGAPDIKPPDFIIDKLVEELDHASNHRYSPYHGTNVFKEAVAYYYRHHYGVKLDVETEILTLIGSKEGIAHFVPAVINPGDEVLVPNPGYPVYQTAVYLAGGTTRSYYLKEENGFLPDFNEIAEETKEKAKLLFLNYPNNPTGATADPALFQEAVNFAKENHMIIAHDTAYDLLTFGDYKAPSILQIPGSKDVSIEFGSLSKSFNMTGWRIGYAVGNKQLISALSILKSNIDSSQFIPIQLAAAKALKSDLSFVEENRRIFNARMGTMHHILTDLGLQVQKPRGTFFLWVKVPNDYPSVQFAEKLLQDAQVMVTPGTAFGSGGEGYIRIALTVSEDRIKEVGKRLEKLTW